MFIAPAEGVRPAALEVPPTSKLKYKGYENGGNVDFDTGNLNEFFTTAVGDLEVTCGPGPSPK